ncbi:hypothetical protein QQ045_002124 [Rhodiola kirilowii]
MFNLRPDQFDIPYHDRPGRDKVGKRIRRSAGQNCEDASGICSPPLWKTSNPHQNLTSYSQLSAAEKARAVAKGQEELNEMVKNMPEPSYELSLKDIVEYNHRRVDENRQIGDHNNIDPLYKFRKEEIGKRKAGGIMKRSGSVDDGKFLLKMFLPFDFKSKAEKKRIVLNEPNKHGGAKVSPRPSSVRTWDGFSLFGDSESVGRTIRSNSGRVGTSRSSSSRTISNNNRHSGGIFLTGCWSVFSFNKKLSDD